MSARGLALFNDDSTYTIASNAGGSRGDMATGTRRTADLTSILRRRAYAVELRYCYATVIGDIVITSSLKRRD